MGKRLRVFVCILILAIGVSGGNAFAANHDFKQFVVASKDAALITSSRKAIIARNGT